jgi:hypothetical protein
VNLAYAYTQGRTAALQKFALEAPSPADQLIAAIEQAPDGPPLPAALAAPQLPQPIPQAPPEIAAQPIPPENSFGKDAALGLQQMLALEKAMGQQDAASMFADVERQMSGKGGGRTGTLQIGPQGTEFQARPKLPAPAMKPPASSLGARAAEHVITSAKRPLPGVRAR